MIIYFGEQKENNRSEPMKINTENLYIREFKIADITDIYLSSLNDNSIIGLTEARHQKWDREKVEKFIVDSNRENISALLGVFNAKSDKPIGNIRLFNYDVNHKRVELSLLFYDKGEWGKGYATEAVGAIVEYVFSVLKLHRIYADYYSVNKASARVFEKTGFNVEGIFKNHFYLNDHYVDSVRIARINNVLISNISGF